MQEKSGDFSFYPHFIDNTNFRYINVDGKYVANIVIIDYPQYVEFLQIMDSIPKYCEYDMSMFIRKKDTNQVLKELTFCISNAKSELSTIYKEQLDIDIIDKLVEDAKLIRKEIQINNEEVFYINIILTFFSYNISIIKELKTFQSKLYCKNIMSIIPFFRQLDYYKYNLPLNISDNLLFDSNYKNITTSALVNFFPFYTNSTFDENGIIFGVTKENSKIFNIDIFDNKYLNSNFCILGSSGSGKSFFTKLIILRHYLKNKRQYIFDLEAEYVSLAKYLKIDYIDIISNNTKMYFNIFDINMYDILVDKENFFNNKVYEITTLLCNILVKKNNYFLNFCELLKNYIEQLYFKFNITANINSILKKSNKDSINIYNNIIDKEKFPTILDLYNIIKESDLKRLLKEQVIEKYHFLTNFTNFNITQKLNIFKLDNLYLKDNAIIINYFLNIIQKILKADINNNINTIIYIDEVWRYINFNNDLAINIFSLFKTIRKLNSSIVVITQDIEDFFKFNNGDYGKSILNNSEFKLFFKLDYSDKKILKNISTFKEKDIDKIFSLDKGQGVIFFKNNNCVINILANGLEYKIIEEEYYENSYRNK